MKAEEPAPPVVAVRKRTRPPAQQVPAKPKRAKTHRVDNQRSSYATVPTVQDGGTLGLAGEAKIKTGRPDKRSDPAVVEMLIQYITAGNPYETCCYLAGVDATTFRAWMRQGKEAPDGTFARSFYMRVKKAVGEACHRNLMRIQKGTSSWTSSAWFLERRFPEEFGRKDNLRLGTDQQSPLMMGVVTASADDKVISQRGAVAALKAVLQRRPDLLVDV